MDLLSELRNRFGSVVTVHPWSGGQRVTFTTFGGCIADGIEVPCSTALGRLFEEGWMDRSQSRDEEMKSILKMLSWMSVMGWICHVSFLLTCWAIISWMRRRTDRNPLGYFKWSERNRRVALALMGLSTLALAITSCIGLHLGTRLSATILGSLEYPSLNISILGVIGLSYGTLWFFFVDRGSLPLTVESITVMGKIEPNQGDVQYSYIHLENQKA